MPLFLLDTNHAAHLLDPDDALWSKLRSLIAGQFAISLTTLGELSFMVEKSRRRTENRQRRNLLQAGLLMLPYTETEAMLSGVLRAEAQRKGFNVSTADSQIAAVARQNEVFLLTTDSDFDVFSNIRVENWLSR